MRWRVNGIPPHLRKRARDAAKAADLPLGPWVERAIHQELAGQDLSAPAPSVEPAAMRDEPETEFAITPIPPPDGIAADTVIATDAEPFSSIDPPPADTRGTQIWPAGRVRRIGLIALAASLAVAAIAAVWLWQPAPKQSGPQEAAITPVTDAPTAPAGDATAKENAATDTASTETIPAEKSTATTAPDPDSTATSAPPPKDSAQPSPASPPKPPSSSEPQSPSDAIANLQRDALNGNAMAQHDLALAYVNGRGVPQNYEIAAGWFEKAANAGLERAQFNLAVLYENALGVSQDPKRAFELYRAAAEQGFAPAQHSLGVAYAEGRGTEQDYRAATLWFRRAADQGIVSAQYNLGMIYEKGLAGPPDPQTAYGWYRRAAAAGSEAAVARLAVLEGRITPPSGKAPAPKAAKPTRAEIEEIQRLLAQLSFDAGPPDGKAGPTTRAAIRQYEKIAGLKVTGEPTVALLDHLRQVITMMRTSR
jgi:TPR repeat protein